MDTTFQKIPFLRITLALAGGITLASFFTIPSYVFLVLAVATTLALLVIQRRYTFKSETAFGSFTLLLFVFIGATIYSYQNTQKTQTRPKYYMATLLEKPQEKANSYKSVISITSVVNDSNKTYTKEKVLVYFEKSEEVQNLAAGTQILFQTSPTFVQNFGTPYSFNYKAYLQNKGIYRQVYLSTSNWQATQHSTKSLVIYAEQVREELLKIYRNHNLGKNETEILSALTLGYKRGLDPETKRIFSAAGAMHILAVSGLHVGIIYLLLNFLLGFLKRKKAGAVLFSICAILLLWMYAFITGLSPSVLRAATMFSILIIGDNMQRKASVYNSLAASALFLLLLNPNNLFEVGFQLSYSAVFGIVFLQPKLVKQLPVKNKVAHFFWSLLCVSIAAQIATFPLSAYYFNQFPLYFALTNLIVIPAATALIPLGISLLLFAKIPFLSVALAFCLNWLIKVVYISLQWIEQLPYSVLDFTIRNYELPFLIASLFFTFLFLKNKRAKALKLTLVSVFLFSTSILYSNFQQQKSNELIVFNTSSKLVIQLISGRTNYVISNQDINNDAFLLRLIEEINRKKRLRNTVYLRANSDYEDKMLLLHKGVIGFQHKTIVMQYDRKAPHIPVSPNYFITNNNLSLTTSSYKAATSISTGYVKYSINNRRLHSLKTNGTFCEKW